MTRSGRRVVPVLAWWTNQRISGCKEAVFIEPGTPNLLQGTEVKTVKQDEVYYIKLIKIYKCIFD